MSNPVKQHLIDPEACIRCYTCENTCPANAIIHDDNNVVVKAEDCNFCLACIPVCPTGSIDAWRFVKTPFSTEDQFGWEELPEQMAFASPDGTEDGSSQVDESIAALLAEAHISAGGRSKAPASAAKPAINLYNLANPIKARVQGNFRLTSPDSGSDVRHMILEFGANAFPVLEGQSIGIIPPGVDKNGKAHLPRLYSISSPRDGERPNYNNISLTVKREPDGLCSNYVCDLKGGEEVMVTGPFGSTFLMPEDERARILMICTGTGSAPFRAFTMQRQRVGRSGGGGEMVLFFGARTPDSLPYFGPLEKVPESVLKKHLVFSRIHDKPKEYVQDRLLAEKDKLSDMLKDPQTHIYICGLRGMEEGVEKVFSTVANGIGANWKELRDSMRDEGRYHIETY
jgi:benzoyl-CoA 2,3-dioxygenase component A